MFCRDLITTRSNWWFHVLQRFGYRQQQVVVSCFAEI
jgi:hypothetical protein